MLTAALAATCAVVQADFSYQESTQMTGGTMLTVLKLGGPFTRGARAAQISTVAVKGNRMMRSDKDSVSILDLDKETITDIDLDKKQYSVTTFAQIRAAMEKAMAELRKREKTTNDVDLKFKVSAKSTGRTKEIRALSAKELLIGMEMQATDAKSGQTGAFNVANEAWMASVRGYDEVKAFELKLADKLAATFRPGMEQMAMTQPAMVQGLAEAAKEMAKVDGVPVQSIVRMGSGSAEELQAAGQRNAEAKADNKGKGAAATAGAVAGALTGFGGFGRRKNKEEDKQAKSEDGKQAAGAMILMEMTTDLSDFSTAAVDEAKFQIPAGFKEVQSELAKRAK
jgi:hypothetical protein